MAEFSYTALDTSGREVSGALQAESRAAALSRLKGMGVVPVSLNAGGAATIAAPTTTGSSASPRAKFQLFGGRVSDGELTIFTRQLASLFSAGLNMARCLDTLIDHCENPAMKRILDAVKISVSAGSSLWEAFSEHPKVFSELYVNLVRAGESSGQLGKVLDRLADSLEEQQEYRSRVKSALAYPALLLTAGMGAVIFILLFLVPRFSKIFNSLNKPLPAPTKALLSIQSFISHDGWMVLVGIAILVLVIRWWDKTDQGGLTLDRLRMRMPVMGSIIHKETVSRFCRTMATLVEGGVPILSSFEVAERAVGNRVLRRAIEQVRNAVREGETLAHPLRRTGVFPGLVTNMVAVGEETGNLHEMLNRVADAYDAEISNRMRQIVSLVEPCVILFMGLVIGAMVLSMLIPVLELSTGF